MAERIHLHLLSDSTGETLEMLAKAALAQFEGADVVRHFWPMVRSRQHLSRILPELAAKPGLVLFTLVNPETRQALEAACSAAGMPAVPILDRVTAALEAVLPYAECEAATRDALKDSPEAVVDAELAWHAVRRTLLANDPSAWGQHADAIRPGYGTGRRKADAMMTMAMNRVRSDVSLLPSRSRAAQHEG